MKTHKKNKTIVTPRKVRVGTVVFDTNTPYTTLLDRIDALDDRIDRILEGANKQYDDASLDLIVLPEDCLGRKGESPEAGALTEAELPIDWIRNTTKRTNAYLVLPFVRRVSHSKSQTQFFNSAFVYDRRGEKVLEYDKIHPVLDDFATTFENGVTPGSEVPICECDFGTLALQICFDMDFDDGWEVAVRKGAEIVAWPTESPQYIRPAWRALAGDMYIISSTTRENARVFSPIGLPTAEVVGNDEVLVAEIDLSYARLNFSHPLRNGEAVRERWGDDAGYMYSETEDMGLFWSNDNTRTIGSMLEELDLQIDLDRMVSENERHLKPYRPLR